MSSNCPCTCRNLPHAELVSPSSASMFSLHRFSAVAAADSFGTRVVSSSLTQWPLVLFPAFEHPVALVLVALAIPALSCAHPFLSRPELATTVEAAVPQAFLA